jgi:hypothetical protein
MTLFLVSTHKRLLTQQQRRCALQYLLFIFILLSKVHQSVTSTSTTIFGKKIKPNLFPSLTRTYTNYFFYVLLTGHISITLANDKLDAQFFLNTFIIILHTYTFRAKSCSSSGRQIVLIHRGMVSSLSVSDDTRCCINTIWPLKDEQDIAQNMYI